ncbi:MAG TPA: OadG family protein [Bacillota bacterium]|nr:MAG: Oxaloacetate decarboxylase, gamma chain [Firmicutes bacterium ADurb.Bin153]HNV34296.1 OadG family protein [Bacillota bacterium]
MDNIGLGMSTTGLGMLIVFLGLVFLMFIMLGLAGISKIGGKKPAAAVSAEPAKAAPKADGITAVAPEPARTVAETVVRPAAGGGADEIAAISAVMAIMMSEGISGQVTAVRPIGAKINTWALAGRRDLMAGRL